MAVSSFITVGNKYCLDPARLREQATSQGLPTDHWFGRCNRYTNVRGKGYGYGWFLMLKSDVDTLTNTSPVEVAFNDGEGEIGNSIVFPNLRILRSVTLYPDNSERGTTSDETACLVHIADIRCTFPNSTIDRQFNVHWRGGGDEDYDPDSYYTATMLGGAPGPLWSWQVMLNFIWSQIPGCGAAPGLYSSPTLPFSPNGNPQELKFIGISAWDAYNQVLDKIHCALTYDPEADTFAVVDLSLIQVGLSITLKVLTDLTDDNFPDYSHVELPETIRVFFPVMHIYGSERTLDRENPWNLSTNISVDRGTLIAGATAGSILPIWDDLPALYGIDGLISNSADLNSRAIEVAEDLASRLLSDTKRFRVRFGIHSDIQTGEDIGTVAWGDIGDSQGMITEILGVEMSLPESWQTKSSKETSTAEEPWLPPDIARFTYPVYPPVTRIVKITADDRESSGLWSAEVKRVALDRNFATTTPYSHIPNQVECWAWPIEHQNILGTYHEGLYFFGRLHGIYDDGTGPKPLFVADIRRADMVHGLLKSSLAATDALAHADNLIGYDGFNPTNNSTDPITANNRFCLGGNVGDPIIFQYCEVEDEWDLIQITQCKCEGNPPFTGFIQYTDNLWRNGDYVYTTRYQGHYVDGLLCSSSSLSDISVYICCDSSPSSPSSVPSSPSSVPSSPSSVPSSPSSTPSSLSSVPSSLSSVPSSLSSPPSSPSSVPSSPSSVPSSPSSVPSSRSSGISSESSIPSSPSSVPSSPSSIPSSPSSTPSSRSSGISSDSSVPSSPSSVPSSPSSIPANCGGVSCKWVWNFPDVEQYTWQKDVDCITGCSCSPPQFPGIYQGQVEYTICTED